MRSLIPRRLLEKLFPAFRPPTEVEFLLTDFGSVGLGWHSYMNAMPPSMFILEHHPFSLGRVHSGPLLLQFELPNEVDNIARGPDDYGPLLFLLLHIRRTMRHIQVTLSRSAQPGLVHVLVNTDRGIVTFDKDVAAHYVDEDTPPHVVLD